MYHREKRAVTLIELLVVMAILIVLAGLIFVIARPAVFRAQLNDCKNCLRQFHSAMSMYASDHDGYIPPIASPLAHPPTVRSWFEALEGYGAKEDIWKCRLHDRIPPDPEPGSTIPLIAAFTTFEAELMPIAHLAARHIQDAQGNRIATLVRLEPRNEASRGLAMGMISWVERDPDNSAVLHQVTPAGHAKRGESSPVLRYDGSVIMERLDGS